ncbi:hypothetical protein QJS04_geneDACA016832 [Acorus gramineus]|uniref:Uncharacterized protein n=1 Tax=Acorus gramineus TaxID=55184 RepID=A0AAV9ARZ9_ACOGR|nr:hypothetical protein QJS04_geneDACA016832 [Acorus gramineus]
MTAKDKCVFDFDGMELRESQSTHLVGRNIELVHAFANCLNNAPTEVYNKAKELVSSLKKEKESLSACGSNEPTRWSTMSIPSSIDVRPPNISKTKGSGKRLKGGMEIAMEEKEKQRRTCSVCGKKEKHNKRSCPMLKEIWRWSDVKEVAGSWGSGRRRAVADGQIWRRRRYDAEIAGWSEVEVWLPEKPMVFGGAAAEGQEMKRGKLKDGMEAKYAASLSEVVTNKEKALALIDLLRDGGETRTNLPRPIVVSGNWAAAVASERTRRCDFRGGVYLFVV